MPNWASVNGSRTLQRLGNPDHHHPYPWVEGEPHHRHTVSSTGLTFSGEVPVADAVTPAVTARYLTTFAFSASTPA